MKSKKLTKYSFPTTKIT